MAKHDRRSSNAASVLSEALGALRLGIGVSDSSGSIDQFGSDEGMDAPKQLIIGNPAVGPPPFVIDGRAQNADSVGDATDEVSATTRGGLQHFGFDKSDEDITEQQDDTPDEVRD